MSDPSRPPPPLEQRLLGIRLLLVDDDENNRLMLTELMHLYGATTLSASSASEARGVLATNEVDLIISDVGLPDEDGHEFMRKLRAGVGRNAIPAIALTGFAQPADERFALEAGYQAFLTKPVDVELLVDLTHRLTSNTKQA